MRAIGEPPLIVCVEPLLIVSLSLSCVLLKEVTYGCSPLKNPMWNLLPFPQLMRHPKKKSSGLSICEWQPSCMRQRAFSLWNGVSSILSARKKICTMKCVLCVLPKNKTPLLIIACCSILLEESSFQKHPKSPFDQPSKILQFSLTKYLIPYFTLAFCYVQNGKLSIFPKTPPIVILNAYCMVGMPPFPLVVCWPCPYMQHVSIFTWQRRIMQPTHLINPQIVYGIVSFKCETHRVLFFFGMVSSPSKVTSSL